jgi:2-C-methyl-D-erythritol 2,4-cyclodiphosphate synthase
MRVGIGYDVHPLTQGRRLILGGVEIPFDKGLDGHSDADVVVHSIIDALLGAAGLGDIGTHFPSSEPNYKGISSIVLLRRVATMLKEEGWRIYNVDATVVAEQPRLAPFIPRMRELISQTLEVSIDRVGVKSTTSKGLGFVGEGQAIAVHAVALVDEAADEAEG